MKKTTTLLLLLFVATFSVAQSARVQIIHNSPSPTVDIYANDGLLLNDFAFRTATPFIDVPAEVELNIGVATADSESAADAIANFPVTFEDGKTYVVVATGIVGGNPGFNLAVTDMGMEMADSPENVGILFYHGSPDAPTVDVLAGGSPIIDDVSYGEFQGYLNVPAAAYALDVTPGNDNSTIVASYSADLSFWAGKTAVIFASGFLSGDSPAFEPWVALSNGGTFPLAVIDNTPPAPTARLQVIHNSPTPTVDIYANDGLLLNDFAFRTATPFIDVPAGVELNIGVATADSESAADAIANFPITLEEGKTYVVVATGIVGGEPGFNLAVTDMGMEMADSPDNVGILFYHGSPDAPTVDVVAGGSPIIDDASYGEFQGYLNVPAASYVLDVTPGNDNSTIVASYNADLGFWAGRTAVIFASGFLSGDDPAFEPWVALSNGGTFPLSLIDNTPEPATARVQVIHNSPSPTVDVYANGDLLLDNFAYRTATPFVDVPAGVEIVLGVATADSESAADVIATFPVTLEEGKTYVVVATGIVGGEPGFNLAVNDMGMEMADSPDNIGILFYHGSPDAPTVDVVAGGSPIIDDVSYGEFQGYLNVPAASYVLDVTPGNDNSTVVASYSADLGFWAGRTAVIFASGFLGGDNPSFEPWVALSNGGTFPLSTVMGEGFLGQEQNFQANTSKVINSISLSPNPASDRTDFKVNLEEDTELQVQIINKLGQVVQSLDYGKQSAGIFQDQLYLYDLPTGNYYISVFTQSGVQSKAIMISRL